MRVRQQGSLDAIGQQIVSASQPSIRYAAYATSGGRFFIYNFGRDIEMGMLILSRLKGEVIMIGDDIVITVVDCQRGNVRIGIDAPRGVPVHRREVYEANKAKASKVAP